MATALTNAFTLTPQCLGQHNVTQPLLLSVSLQTYLASCVARELATG